MMEEHRGWKVGDASVRLRLAGDVSLLALENGADLLLARVGRGVFKPVPEAAGDLVQAHTLNKADLRAASPNEQRRTTEAFLQFPALRGVEGRLPLPVRMNMPTTSRTPARSPNSLSETVLNIPLSARPRVVM